MIMLRRAPIPMDNPPAVMPRVTLMITAKDEVERIRACIESALAQDYPNFSVIAIDDRSTDNTGAVMDDIAARHPKLKAFHNTVAPPPGWTGKNNALHQGVKHADGDWLLFVDSDVVLEPDALRGSMELVLRKGFDLISLLPRLESHTMWESLLVPLAGSAASSMYLVPLTNNHLMKDTAFANGQFLLISRKAYEAIGGHETVRDRYCEDVEIARLLKTTGWKPRVAWGNEFCAVRMYSSLEGIFKGWGRIFYAGRAGSPWRVIAAVTALLLCCLTAYVALAYGMYRGVRHADWGWFTAAAIHLGMLTFFVSTMYAWTG